MTKYEWEKELRRNLSRMPRHEAERALSYYGELFADKAEQGYSEREIVGEFGNPFDVATAIIRDYEAEHGALGNGHTPPAADRYNPHTGEKYYTQDEYERQIKSAKTRGALGAFMRVIFIIPYFVLFVTVASILVGFTAVAVCCVAGGLFGVGFSFTLISSGGLLFGACMGTALVVIGVGGLFLLTLPPLYKSLKAVSKIFFGLKLRKTNTLEVN